jgi:copper homeostasis protein
MGKRLLEVIVCSLADAIEAERGGADRLEVVSRLDVGGLTPALSLVQDIKIQVSLPLRVMIRESTGFQTSGRAELERLCESAQAFSALGVDGIVFGFLKGNDVDSESIAAILESVPSMKATFHHAFEAANDKLALIHELKKFSQIDRILAHGGEGSWPEKIGRLAEYQKIAAPEICILVGGGLDRSIIEMLSEKGCFNEFHVGLAAREDGKVKSLRVAELVKAMSDML